MFYTDPHRHIESTEAALLWLGLDPSKTDVANVIGDDVVACSIYLDRAAEAGDLSYHKKTLFQEKRVDGLEEPIKIFRYTYTVQDLIDFARKKKHRLKHLSDGAAGSFDAPVSRPVPRDSSQIATIAALLAAWPGGASAIPSAKDLEKAAQSLDLSISDDTIRKVLRAAQEAAPSLPLPK